MIRHLTLVIVTLSLIAADASAQTAAPADTRVYELRTYHAAPGMLNKLHNRFRDHTIRLGQQYGITSVGYWVPVENPDNKLICLVSYPDRATRESSWTRLMNDPEWQRIKRASEINGRLVVRIDEQILSAEHVANLMAMKSGQEERLFELRFDTAVPGKLGALRSELRKAHQLTKSNSAFVASWVPTDNENPGTVVTLLAYSGESTDEFISTRKDRSIKEDLNSRDLTERLVLRATDYSPLK